MTLDTIQSNMTTYNSIMRS
uniref:Uncharacterized protein n=1 Tax=Arundo donax TaxID=35708 RepID=A0A0A9HEC9_ARUDO